MSKGPITTRWEKKPADADLTPDPQKKKRRGCLMPIIIAVLIFVIGGSLLPSSDPSDAGATTDINNTQDVPSDRNIPDDVPSTDSDAQQDEKREALNKSLGGSVLFYDNVRNDVTGKWRTLVFYSSENIVDHAVEYYEAYFSSDDEVHMAVNLGLKTTSVMTVGIKGIMFVDVHEYIDGEEHDANDLAGGDLLKQYMIDLETGEIEDLADSSDDDEGEEDPQESTGFVIPFPEPEPAPAPEPEPTSEPAPSTSSGGGSGGGGTRTSGSTGSDTIEITGSLDRTAYWTSGGKSYHFSASCSTLARSKNILSGTLQDALDAGKLDPCDRCAYG